ncbi:hypothetical protein XENOCAPTIV_028391 [Xenoophorus captivus]|uniref:Kinesin motor domain-containing protein n=1 Tax=Xenoophorus captivus TaxID=1517983 RepID=A0ABV0QNE5_9TELE
MIPCAISWLYSSIERRREKTWTDLTVSVSAIELCCGEEDTLRDLLGEVVPSPGSVQDSPKAHIRVTEDPVYGIQVQESSRGTTKLTMIDVCKEVDVDFRSLRLRGKLYRSSSDQSCDTVIQINLDGSAHSKAAPLLTQPEFVPIIPSLHPNKSDLDDPEFTALLQELLRIPQLHGEKKTEETVQGDSEGLGAEGKPPERDCLKCDTFAELQERLGCIDGSEVTMEVLKSSLKGATLKNILTKTLPQKETFKAPHTLLNVGKCCSQATVGEKQTDGSLPGDSFKREDSGLFDCEECSANSSSEELMNHALGLSMAYPSVLPTTRAVKSGNNVPSKCFEANSQSKAATNPSEYQLQEKQENHEAADWFKPDKRASPIGNSSPISPSSSCSSSHSMAKTVVIGDHKAKDSKEMKATITVTVQQPLDKMGQDELVFSMVEEVIISGAYDSATTGGNIICIRDPAQSQEHGQTAVSSQPIRIIADVSDDCSAAASTVVQPASTDQNNEKAAYQFKREIRLLPSFINPMLMNMNLNCELDGAKENESTCAAFKEINSASELKRLNTKGLENNNVDKQSQSCASEIHHLKKSDETCSQICYDQLTSEDKDFCKKTLENKMCEKRLENTHKGHPQACKHAPSTHNQKVSEVVEIACRQDGSNHKTTGVSSGCYETMPGFFATGSLPRSWQKSNHRENPSRVVISSTPCSPGESLERMHGRRQSTENHSLYTSSPQKYIPEVKQDSGKTRKHGKSSSRLRCPADNSSRLFNTKLEQLARRTNSLGRTSRDFPIIERGTSSTSMSSKGSNEASCKASYKENYDGDSTFPRANRSPRRNPRSEHSHHFFHTENPLLQSAKHSHSKLSAVGKLKIATPKVRRQSAPSIKNLSHKALQQSSRSASLSADSKMVSFERTSSFFSSSPPRSYRSISRTPSQSSTCSSTKSAIQGFVNGRLTDLLRERSSSPSSSGPDQMSPLRSPYSQMTAPRTPDHLSGHASDTTSVLSGDLPPAMGKTSLHFSNRSSLVSSGYDSLVRDSEAMGSATSNRDSVSNRSGSLLSVTRSSRSSRRRGNTGKTPLVKPE